MTPDPNDVAQQPATDVEAVLKWLDERASGQAGIAEALIEQRASDELVCKSRETSRFFASAASCIRALAAELAEMRRAVQTWRSRCDDAMQLVRQAHDRGAVPASELSRVHADICAAISALSASPPNPSNDKREKLESDNAALISAVTGMCEVMEPFAALAREARMLAGRHPPKNRSSRNEETADN